MILVAGSTGLVGMEVCRLLVQQGTPVRALVRYSIKQDEASPSVKNPDGKTPKAAAGAASGKESGPKPSAAPPPKPALKPPSAGQRFVAP